VVSQQEIRDNEYNLNIPRYVDSSESSESWDIYASMYGGIPKSEIAAFDDYFAAFEGLKEVLFAEDGSPYARLSVSDPEEAIRTHASVTGWGQKYESALAGFAASLKTRLVDGWKDIHINGEEAAIAKDIFERLSAVPLVDKYAAYQSLDDEWQKTAADLEILQTETFAATRKVDPNMVLKKKDGKDQEVQDGWVGHVIPFELVQSTLLKPQADALHAKEERLSEIAATYEEIIDSLSEEEKESHALNEAKDAFVAAAVQKIIKEQFGTVAWAKAAGLDVQSFECKLIQVTELATEEKTIKAAIKKETAELHMLTKSTIEGLTDSQAAELLELKWIAPLMDALHRIPTSVVADFTARIRALAEKYAVTYAEVATQISDTKSSLSDLIDGLAGSDFDMKGLAEFQSLLRGENNG
jgi:type I restriction enzyme M protein